MHDIKEIRKNPEDFDKGMRLRGLKVRSLKLLKVDKIFREILERNEKSKFVNKEITKELSFVLKALKKEESVPTLGVKETRMFNKKAKHLKERVLNAKKTLAQREKKLKKLKEEINEISASIPNIPSLDVPEGKDETENKLLREESEPPKFDFRPKAHDAIGEGLGEMDFPRAAKIAGARFSLLYGRLAKLERALATFMLDTHTREFGYTEVCAPVLVRAETLLGSGHLPKFDEDLFKTRDGRYLIPTAETVLTGLHSGEVMEEADFPRRYVAWTNCFRAEAGAAGRDTRGLLRLHQFSKVELVSYTLPEDSSKEHERMTRCAEAILKRLGLSYRVMLLCAGDMGFAAEKTYDLEVWMPAQGVYREISSCSNCGAFQSRRLNARFRRKGGKGTEFPHALNGSGLAVGRTMAALLENGQREDGSVLLPEVLWEYMGGVKELKSG